MNKNKRLKIVMILLVLTIMFGVMVNLVEAVGVSPAQRYINYKPGEEQEFKITIFNSEDKDFTAFVYMEGDLAEYVKLEDNYIEFKKGEKSKIVHYTFTCPENINKPGIHESELRVVEMPKEGVKGEVGVGTILTISSLIKLRVPYPNEYAEANLYIEDAEVGENVNFLIPVFNYGANELNDVYAKVEIYGATYEKIGEVVTSSLNIMPGKQEKLGVSWNADVNQGTYKAVATIYYGGRNIKIEKLFDIGSMYIKINGIDVGEFVLGSVAKFDILIENIWSEEIKDVYADIIFKDETGNEENRFKTANINVESYENGILSAYWDTTGIDVGKYYLDITLNYAGKTSNSLIETFVNLDSITSNSLIGNVIKGNGNAKQINLLILGLIILVIVNVGWFMYFKKSKTGKKK
ncbi:MAG: hypothetical protein KAQ83_00695 [Nanoarchaeota archaeon]|nr:hypothetical protein [Nanoarchaeota archaeon]